VTLAMGLCHNNSVDDTLVCSRNPLIARSTLVTFNRLLESKIKGEKFEKWIHNDMNFLEQDKNGDTLMHLLVKEHWYMINKEEQFEICELIKKIADYEPNTVNLQNKKKETPLYLALKYADSTHNLDVAKILLKNGATLFDENNSAALMLNFQRWYFLG